MSDNDNIQRASEALSTHIEQLCKDIPAALFISYNGRGLWTAWFGGYEDYASTGISILYAVRGAVEAFPDARA